MTPVQPPGEASAVSFARSLKAVAWSFLGIRQGAAFRQDLARVSPLHIIVAGLAAALTLVLGLMLLVSWVVAK